MRVSTLFAYQLGLPSGLPGGDKNYISERAIYQGIVYPLRIRS